MGGLATFLYDLAINIKQPVTLVMSILEGPPEVNLTMGFMANYQFE